MKTTRMVCFLAFVIILANCKEDDHLNPRIITSEVIDISPNSAKGVGQILSKGTLPILSCGVCWGLEPNPGYSDNHSSESVGSVKYFSIIDNLNADSTYYARAYYINKNDTFYGNEVKFTTPNYIIFNPNVTYGSVKDVDGNEYKTVKIGNQTWMAENLKVAHYRTGDPIPNVTALNQWGHFQISTGAYCWYNNDISNKNIYGALYNWYAATDTRNIAPQGWHVASVSDWQVLAKYLNQNNDLNKHYGLKLREISTAHWISIESLFQATNETGFTALPGGKVDLNKFMNLGRGYAFFWTITGTLDGSSCVYIGDYISIDYMQPNCKGFSIRCVKD